MMYVKERDIVSSTIPFAMRFSFRLPDNQPLTRIQVTFSFRIGYTRHDFVLFVCPDSSSSPSGYTTIEIRFDDLIRPYIVQQEFSYDTHDIPTLEDLRIHVIDGDELYRSQQDVFLFVLPSYFPPEKVADIWFYNILGYSLILTGIQQGLLSPFMLARQPVPDARTGLPSIRFYLTEFILMYMLGTYIRFISDQPATMETDFGYKIQSFNNNYIHGFSVESMYVYYMLDGTREFNIETSNMQNTRFPVRIIDDPGADERHIFIFNNSFNVTEVLILPGTLTLEHTYDQTDFPRDFFGLGYTLINTPECYNRQTTYVLQTSPLQDYRRAAMIEMLRSPFVYYIRDIESYLLSGSHQLVKFEPMSFTYTPDPRQPETYTLRFQNAVL